MEPPKVEVVEATVEESNRVAIDLLRQACEYLERGDREHAAVWVHSARIWMGDR